MSEEALYDALESGEVIRPILMASFHFDTATVRVWSGYGDLNWNGFVWSGTGDMGDVSPAAEDTKLRANAQTYRLTGIPAEYLGVLLNERYQGRRARLRLGILDPDGAVIGAYRLSNGTMDTALIEDSGTTGSIILTAESALVDLERPRERRFTDEDQKDLHPGDNFLKAVAEIQNKEIVWK